MNLTYDAKSRLTRATGNFGTVRREDYQYDDNDNRTVLEQRTSTTATTPSLTAASTISPGTNRLASITTTTSTGTGTRTLSYNGRGDMTSELRDTVPETTSYDAYGRLTSYARRGTTSAAMLYSSTDERVQVTLGTTPRRFVHDESGRLIGEYGATGTVFAEHVWLMPDTDEGGWEPLALLGANALICPFLSVECVAAGFIGVADDPSVSPAAVAMVAALYAPHLTADDPRISPLNADAAMLARLPPTLVQVSAAETLRGQALQFTQKLWAQQHWVRLSIWPDMPHVWHAFIGGLAEASAAIEEAALFLAD